MTSRPSRRSFLSTTAAASGVAVAAPYFLVPRTMQGQEKAPSDRPKIGCIGTGDRWKAVGVNAMAFADCVAICDVDGRHLREGADIVEKRQGRRPEMFEDYQRILDNKEIEVVTIVTPDHWHVKQAIEALQAGKHVYCEKPLTLTIEEGKLIRQVVKDTGKVFQVGTQQRSEMGQMFMKAVAIAREGRLGTIEKITCGINGAPTSPAIPVAEAPKELNWEKWLGQAPVVDYRHLDDGSRWGKSRCHYEFRWWYEYSGGKMTDWGAHHVDIAHWAIGADDTGPVKIVPVMVEHPVDLKDGMPVQNDRYNVAHKFRVECEFANGPQVIITSEGDNGVLIEGTEGRIFVNRGRLSGAPVDQLADKPLKKETLEMLYKGKRPHGGNEHMRNFFECVADGGEPVSDVASHHRAMSTCHLANIAVRLGREVQWDPQAEKVVGDEQAAAMTGREQRAGYEIKV